MAAGPALTSVKMPPGLTGGSGGPTGGSSEVTKGEPAPNGAATADIATGGGGGTTGSSSVELLKAPIATNNAGSWGSGDDTVVFHSYASGSTWAPARSADVVDKDGFGSSDSVFTAHSTDTLVNAGSWDIHFGSTSFDWSV